MSNSIVLWKCGDAYPENWPEWLRDADIEWCRVEVRDGGAVVWHDGVWYDGTWDGGRWLGGIWRKGYWHDGSWYAGEWYDGDWNSGVWHGGFWYGGHWHDGVQWRTDGPPATK